MATPPTVTSAPAPVRGDVVTLTAPASSSPAPTVAVPPSPVSRAVAPDAAFEQKAESFARFARNQAEAGFRVSLRLSPAQVRKLSETQVDILSKHQIQIDVVDTPLATVRPGASHLERQVVLEENDRSMLTPSSYFANNYAISPRAVLAMGI